MSSQYPGGLDSFETNKTNASDMDANTVDNVGDHAQHHNDLADAVNKIEAELGINPSDAFATVKARLDSLGGGSITWLEHLVRYVDPINGDDANAGLGPDDPMETIQAAYDDLVVAAHTFVGGDPGGVDLGVGTIYLAPGEHDVGTGITFNNNRPVELIGTLSGHGRYGAYKTASVIMSSSPAATQFVNITNTATVGRGHIFRDIAFRISSTTNTSLTKVIHAQQVCHLTVENCIFSNLQTSATSVCAIYHTSAGDASWAHIFNNVCAHMQFYRCPSGAGSNFNRNRIQHNKCFYGGSLPIIHLEGDFLQGDVSFNNLEGPVGAPAIKVDSSNADWNTFMSNSGEGGGATHPFYHFTNGNNNVIVGGVCKSSGVTGIFAQFETPAYSNVIVGSYDYVGQNGYMRKIVDNSTYGNKILDGRWGMPVKYKEGTNPTFSASDFNNIPPEGALVGITYNTSTTEHKFWFYSNDSYQSLSTLAILSTEKGAANGVATLDANTKVPLAQISEVLEIDELEDVPAKPTTGNHRILDLDPATGLWSYIDTPAGGAGITWPDNLVRYVDYVNGLDTNSGLGVNIPMKTIQAAYNALKTAANALYTPHANGMGVGCIVLSPGDHEVGSGVVIDQDRPVEIRGTRSGHGGPNSTNSQSRIVSNSTTATEFILTGSTTDVTYGNVFRDLTFLVKNSGSPQNTALTACIRTRANTHLIVENCAANRTGANGVDNCYLLVQNPGGTSQDNAWMRFVNNKTSGIALYKCEAGTNFNRSTLAWNTCFYSRAYPMIHLEGDFRDSYVVGNALEGNAIGIQLDSDFCDFNWFVANYGENSSTGISAENTPFFKITGSCQGNKIDGFHSTTPSGTNGLAVQITGANAHGNFLYGTFSKTGSTGSRNRVIDSSTNKNFIEAASGPYLRYKTGTSPTIADSDFPNVVDDSCLGITYNTSTLETRIWIRVAGAWTYISNQATMTGDAIANTITIPDTLVRYVDYVNGLDTNDGFSPHRSMKTIQAAYDDLSTVAVANYDADPNGRIGVGTIYLAPGDHDVGTGLVLDHLKYVEIIGTLSGAHYSSRDSASRIMSSSATATALIKIGTDGFITYGDKIEGVSFLYNPAVNTALTAIIRARACDHLWVTDCFARTSDDTVRDVVFLEQSSVTANDNMCLRLLRNTISGLPLYRAHATGGNYNRSIIGWNACFYGVGGSMPMIWLEGNFWHSLVIGNNLEGGGSGPHVQVGSATNGADNNEFISNHGESQSGNHPFYKVTNGGFNTFIGGKCTAAAGVTGTWIEFEANGYANKVINPWLRDRAGTVALKRAVIDNSSYPALNVIEGRSGRILWQKTGTNPTFSAADFVSAPGDGSILGVTHNTTTGEKKLWMYINATYVALSTADIPSSEKGAASGVATLDAGSKVPLAQISEVLEIDELEDVPTKPTTGNNRVLELTPGTGQWAYIDTPAGGAADTVGTAVRFVKPDGNDANDGLSWQNAKATIPAAYAVLPNPTWASSIMGGGTIICAPGSYDMFNGGTGLIITAGKPLHLRSKSGHCIWRSGATTYNGDVRLYSSGTITENALITISTDGTHNHYGGGCSGILFDLGTNVGYGIRGYNASRVSMEHNVCIGNEGAAFEQYLARTECTTMGGADASWWRFLDNVTYKACLHRAGIGVNDVGSNNQHRWIANLVGMNVRTQAGIMLYGATRCRSDGNNLEGAGTGGVGFGIMMEQTRQCSFVGDGGEGVPTFIRAIGTSNNNGNFFDPVGITTGQAGKVLISDDNEKRNSIGQNAQYIRWALYGEGARITALKTANYTATVYDELIRGDSTAGGFTVTLPTASNDHGRVHVVRNYGTANAITVASAGGTITGSTSVAAGVVRVYKSDGTNYFEVGAWPTGDQIADTITIPNTLIRYVDYTNGLDTNDGRSPRRAMKTIQAAYNNLKTDALALFGADTSGRLGVGTIKLLPGLHDVGTGVVFDWNRPCVLEGSVSGANHYINQTSESVVYSTSSAATEFIKMLGVDTTGKAWGFHIKDVAFRTDHTVNTSLTKVLWFRICGYLKVTGCKFGNVDTSQNLTVTAIYHEDVSTSGGEAGWFRAVENHGANMQMYKATTVTGAAGGNFDRGIITANVWYYGHTTVPTIHLDGNTRGLNCSWNNLQGKATQVEIGPTGTGYGYNRFENNSGESVDDANPFYKVSASASQQHFVGGYVTIPGTSLVGTFVHFVHASAYNNVVEGPFDVNGAAGTKRKIVDASTANGNFLIHPNHRTALKYKTGASPSFSDTDFTTGPPPNGTQGLTYNTGNGEVRYWVRANGTWHSFIAGAAATGATVVDTLANRPAAAAGNKGMLYYATDDTSDSENGSLYLSNGSVWLALPRTLHGLVNVFVVEDYGAVGDGTTDDSAVFQDIHDNLFDVNRAGTIICTNSIYYWATGVVFTKAGSTIIGQAQTGFSSTSAKGCTQIKVNDGITGFTYGSATVSELRGCRLENLHFFEKTESGSAATILTKILRSSDCSFKNVAWGNCVLGTCLLVDGTSGQSQYNTFENCRWGKAVKAYEQKAANGTRFIGGYFDGANNGAAPDAGSTGVKVTSGDTFRAFGTIFQGYATLVDLGPNTGHILDECRYENWTTQAVIIRASSTAAKVTGSGSNSIRGSIGTGVTIESGAVDPMIDMHLLDLATKVDDQGATRPWIRVRNPSTLNVIQALQFGSLTGPEFKWGTGSPEGVVTARIGSLYSRTDGGTDTSVYRKESGTGNTGWVAISNSGGGGAPTDAQYIVGAANGTLTAEILLSDAIAKGTLASRPAASLGGKLYYVTDSGDERLTRDTGSAWENLTTDWDYVSGKPSTFAPSAHTHPFADLSDFDMILKTADESVSNSTTLQDDDHLIFAIGSSSTEIWFFECFFLTEGANTSHDMKIGLIGPSGATAKWGAGYVAGAGQAGFQGSPSTTAAQANMIEIGGSLITAMIAGYAATAIAGWVFGGGTAGNVVVQWAQNSATAGALIVKKGSFMRVQRLAT